MGREPTNYSGVAQVNDGRCFCGWVTAFPETNGFVKPLKPLDDWLEDETRCGFPFLGRRATFRWFL